ncbi:MAG: type II toxin-antitoxin system VapC family toxin [Candidatus Nanopelagicales bacterium]|nr:type II toxin-antitoxin system VapC family toxin [Candidatus Nanopelagicales bacterium]MDZ4249170.1 type II toxin-antitoxin system VapC family toxin [Candidatus Nanopelagicales bacterium]
MANLLVDTDIFIDHLRGAIPLDPGANRLSYSVVTRAELFAGSSAESALTRLLSPFREIVVDRAVAERAGRIRRDTGVAMPDALIAATALANRLALVTRNQKHFTAIPGLRIRSLGS